MYSALHSKGLQILAVNYEDKLSDINKFAKEAHLTFPLLRNGLKTNDVVKKYGVEGFPTNIVVDRTGKITAVFLGFDPGGLKKALAKLGVK